MQKVVRCYRLASSPSTKLGNRPFLVTLFLQEAKPPCLVDFLWKNTEKGTGLVDLQPISPIARDNPLCIAKKIRQCVCSETDRVV